MFFKCICVCLSCCLFVGQVMFSPRSDQISQRSQVSSRMVDVRHSGYWLGLWYHRCLAVTSRISGLNKKLPIRNFIKKTGKCGNFSQVGDPPSLRMSSPPPLCQPVDGVPKRLHRSWSDSWRNGDEAESSIINSSWNTKFSRWLTLMINDHWSSTAEHSSSHQIELWFPAHAGHRLMAPFSRSHFPPSLTSFLHFSFFC